MKYSNIVKGEFISRPNRFIAKVVVNEVEETVHVKNTGRCKELLVPGCTVYLECSDNPDRKTKYDLIAVQKGEKLINMDSQAPNKVFYEWAKLYYPGAIIRPETTYKDSRFDCYIEDHDKKIFAEVKGVTLEENGYVRFPDAPTERGLKHINGLIDAVKNGYEAMIFFVVQMKEAHTFSPNYDTQPRFGLALKAAEENGVKIFAYNCDVLPDEITVADQIKIVL